MCRGVRSKRIDDAAFLDRAGTALPDDVVELSPKGLQGRDLGVDLGQVLARDRIYLAAGPVLLVR